MKEIIPERAGMNLSRTAEDTLLIELTGNWRIGRGPSTIGEVEQQIEAQQSIQLIAFESKALTAWDSSILTFLSRVIKASSKKGIRVEQAGLPDGVRQLMALATAVPKKEDARKTVSREGFFARVGTDFVAFVQSAGELIAVLGLRARLAFQEGGTS